MTTIVKSRFFVFALFLLFFSIGGLGVWKWRSKESAEKGDKILRTVKVVREDLVQRVTATGEISAHRTTIIASPYDGYIQKQFVRVGEQVNAGDPLVILIPTNQTTGGAVYPIRSPVKGTVVQAGKEGDSFSKPGESILRIDDLSQLYVDSSVPEMEYIKMKKGHEVLIRPSALSERTYQGVVIDLSLASIRDESRWNNSVLNAKFFVRVKILNPDEFLHPGMSVTMDIITNKKEKVLVLPHEFLLNDKGKNFVTFKRGNEKQPIKVGLRNEEYVEILEGVQEGDEILQVDFSLFGENE